MTRSEHLAWAKTRALAYAEDGDVSRCHASLSSDLSKHPELRGHPQIAYGTRLAAAGLLS